MIGEKIIENLGGEGSNIALLKNSLGPSKDSDRDGQINFKFVQLKDFSFNYFR